jgi:hypothetical protein
MRQTPHVRNETYRHQVGYGPRRQLAYDDTLVLWTPLTPREIAKALRPYVVSQPGRTGRKPLLYGSVGPHGMSIERRRGDTAAYPRLNVEYEILSEDTMLFGQITTRRLSGSTLFKVTILSGIMATILALPLSPLAALPFGIVTAMAVGVLLSVAMTLPVFGGSLAWYRRFLLDVLKAEVVGGRA